MVGNTNVLRTAERNFTSMAAKVFGVMKNILSYYRNGSKYVFPRHMKEIAFRFNPRAEKVFKKVLWIYLLTFRPHYHLFNSLLFTLGGISSQLKVRV